MESDQSHTSVTPSKGSSWILRHWRGELNLGISYWVNGVLLGLVIFVALFNLENSGWGITSCNVNPFSIGLYGGLFCIGIWQVVGIWRSAVRHKAVTGKTLWPGLAQFSILLPVLSVAVGGLLEWPAIKNNFQYAETVIENYHFQVLHDGTEVEIRGGIKPGISDDFKKLLAQYPNIKTVQLDSDGGLGGEARRLAGVIRSHGLDTYVPFSCASACIDAFLGGHKRYLRSHAKLGFHSGLACGAPYGSGLFKRITDLGVRDLINRGVKPSFAAKALSTPNNRTLGCTRFPGHLVKVG